MNAETIMAAQDAAKMLIASFCDLEQTFEEFANMSIDESEQEPLRWIPTTERLPENDDELVVVKTASGAKYFGRTIGGRFIDNVVSWFPLPHDTEI